MVSVKVITTTSVIEAVSFFVIFFTALKIEFQQNLNVNDVKAFTAQEFHNHSHIECCNQRICSHKKHCIDCSKSYHITVQCWKLHSELRKTRAAKVAEKKINHEALISAVKKQKQNKSEFPMEFMITKLPKEKVELNQV